MTGKFCNKFIFDLCKYEFDSEEGEVSHWSCTAQLLQISLILSCLDYPLASLIRL